MHAAGGAGGLVTEFVTALQWDCVAVVLPLNIASRSFELARHHFVPPSVVLHLQREACARRRDGRGRPEFKDNRPSRVVAGHHVLRKREAATDWVAMNEHAELKSGE